AGKLIGSRQGGGPVRRAKASGILQPDKSGQVVGDGSVQVVREARARPGNSLSCRVIIAARIAGCLTGPGQTCHLVPRTECGEIGARYVMARHGQEPYDGSVKTVEIEFAYRTGCVADGRIKPEPCFFRIYCVIRVSSGALA